MEEDALINVDNEDIKELIYTIRGKQVMLDSDVARLFKYQTKDLNRNVKNNIARFPEYYCFQLTEEEYESLRCKNFTLNKNGRGQHRKYLPYVFTEYGITMLAGLLKSNIAVTASIKIVNTFIEMKKIILATGQAYERLTNIEHKVLEHDNMFKKVFRELGQEDNIKQKIFFEGQIWDSYNLIVEIIKKAKNKILIIDNYIDDSILAMLSKKKKGVDAVILTSNNSNILKLDVQKFNKEYPTLKVARTNKFHDRFIVIDNKELYHCGASLKDLGKKCFAISRIEDDDYLEKIIDNVMDTV
ncbi:MAG: ORF6N domain-containing protein [Clostridia bacterium]|nr:ORF6N domain-containing protein [Clostridia bacterium]